MLFMYSLSAFAIVSLFLTDPRHLLVLVCQSAISTWTIDLCAPTVVAPAPYHTGCESLLPVCRLPMPMSASASNDQHDSNGDDQGNESRLVWPVTASDVCRVAVTAQVALQNDAVTKV
jgi:hypothetical protein